MSNRSARLLEIYEALLKAYGPQGWWPADSPTEMIIGAILVQHTAWANVEQAITRLNQAGLLGFRALDETDHAGLASLIRPAGTPTVKAERLKAFAHWLGQHYDYDPRAMADQVDDDLRSQLLQVKGIGPETADCIMLYAAGKPAFVVDTYASRVLTRHLLAPKQASHQQLRALVMSNLPPDAALFNEYHALLVRVGKSHCRKSACCQGCPLDHLQHDPE